MHQLIYKSHESKSFGLVTERRHYNAHPIYGSASSVRPVLLFIVKCGIALSLRYVQAMHVFDIRASSSPLGYPSAKFRLWHTLHCWAIPWKKPHTQSLTQSSSFFDSPGTEAFAMKHIPPFINSHPGVRLLGQTLPVCLMVQGLSWYSTENVKAWWKSAIASTWTNSIDNKQTCNYCCSWTYRLFLLSHFVRSVCKTSNSPVDQLSTLAACRHRQKRQTGNVAWLSVWI